MRKTHQQKPCEVCVLPPSQQTLQHWLRWWGRALPSSQTGHKQSVGRDRKQTLQRWPSESIYKEPCFKALCVFMNLQSRTLYNIIIIKEYRACHEKTRYCTASNIFLVFDIFLPLETRQWLLQGRTWWTAETHTESRQTAQTALRREHIASTNTFITYKNNFATILRTDLIGSRFLTILVARLPEGFALWENDGNNEILEGGDIKEAGVLVVLDVVVVNFSVVVAKHVNMWWVVAGTGREGRSIWEQSNNTFRLWLKYRNLTFMFWCYFCLCEVHGLTQRAASTLCTTAAVGPKGM